MSGVTSTKLKETQQDLEKLSEQQTNPQLKERLQVLYLLKLPKALNISQIAKVVGKHRGTVQRWLASHRVLVLDSLLKIKQSPGRKRVIPAWAVASLQRRLEQPEDSFKSYIQVQQWLENTLGVKAEYRTVHELTHYRLKAKLKAGRPTHRQQEPMQIESLKKTL